MSLYNQLFGVNPFSELLVSLIGLDFNSIPRFRDCHLNDTKTRVVIYTRTGGGNRESYKEYNDAMVANENYVTDYDDDFDSTYAYWEFKIPPEYQKKVESLANADSRQVGVKFKELVEAMQNDPDNPHVKKAFEVGNKILGQITQAE